ncbi:MAG: amino acid adenylation domain-containing protein, partial [Selenomonadaceae bacterium]|nr:amino acid adenylation domain-containing protein [Selenomonadaceae bacterium]
SGEFLQKNCLKDISLLNEELANKLAAFNRTETAYDKSSVVEQFRQQVALYPNHQAVVYLDRSYTYAQVDELTDRIAGYLQAKGIGRENVVSVLIPRCEYMVLASLGVLKAGAAYQPLDPTYPKERIGFMMEDASAKLLIAEEGLLDLAEGYAGEVLLTKDIPELPACGSIPAAPAPEDLFVLLYTSGSTGVPKGVMLEHGNLAAFCSWYNDVHAFAPGEHVALYPSYGFDAHMIDFYPAIIRGACVHIIDESIRLDLVLLNDYFEKNNIVHAFMTTQIGRQFMTEMENHSLRALSVGGEKLVPVEPPQNYDVYNVYGPTECTIITTQYMVDKLYYKVPVGKAVNNLKLYVVDKAGKILPPGMPGELWVAGPQVGRGYLNRPELTAKVFIRNPFSNEAGYDRVYRTGDIVRFLPDGTVDFIGRNDGMVKIRGFRIELSEVERVIRQYPGIKDATVADFAAAGGGRFLAAYVVSDETVDIQQLNEFLQERQPPYMVPAVTMQIDRIPLNQNQKVNRKALPVPQKKVQEIVAPQNEVQQRIFDCMAEVIGSREFGITTDIYEAGVTSIGAIRLNVLLSKAFDVVIRNQDLKENNTIEKLEQFVAGAERAVAYEVYPDYPLTQTQKGIFVDSMANAGTTIYNIPSLFRLSDMVELPRLKAAVEQAIDAHPYVKTTLFLDEQGDVRAARNDSDEPVVELIACEQLPGNEELVLPYELLGGRLYRAQVYQTGGGSYLFLDFHHIISDGTSMSIIMGDINRAYNGEELPAEGYTGFEAALDEAKLRQTAAYDKAKAYYDSVFAGCETDYLPMNDRELAVQSVDNINYESSLTVAEIEKFCADHELTLNAFFNGVFGYVLARYNNKEDALFTTIYNGRNDSRLAKTVTMLVKTLPVHCSAAGDRKITDLLTETRDQLMESMANDIYSFAEIAREYEIKPDILFVYQGDEFGDSIIAGEKAQPCDVKLDTAKAPISINVFIRNNKFVFACEYRSDLYRADTMQGILQSLSIASGEFLQKNCLKDISLLNEELANKLDDFNQTEAAYDKSSVVE